VLTDRNGHGVSFKTKRLEGGGMNMTPLIDVTFLLLTFFMLSTHFASAEKMALELPRPDDNQAMDRRFMDKVIINMLYQGEKRPPALTIGPVGLKTTSELSERLSDLARMYPRIEVILRADRRLPYGDVRRIMKLISARNLSHLQVVTELNR